MKIISVECYLGDFICVKVNTDEGISGFGEAGMSYGKCRTAAWGNCQDFARLVIGMDPMDTEKIWEHLHRHTFWGMNGGTTVTAAMAAIDTACWDIKGKALNLPVYKLLGGKTNSSLRTYASQLQFGWRKAIQMAGDLAPAYDPQEYYDVVKEAREEGYTAVKIDPIFVPFNRIAHQEIFFNEGTHYHGALSKKALQGAIKRIEAARDAGGRDMDIIIELHSLTDTNTSIVLMRELEKFDILYCEEPTMPSNPSVFKEIREKLRVPLATGERSYTRWGFRELFQDRLISIAQPDLCNTGGITEVKKICDMAAVYDIGIQLHVCGGPIATAAALQVETVIPNFVIHEEHNANLKQCFKDFGKYHHTPVNGVYVVSELPGIGQEMSEKAMQESQKVVILG